MSYKFDFENSSGWSGVDTNVKLTSSAGLRFRAFLKNNSVQTVIRYYASSKLAKTLSPEEAQALTKDGFNILPVFQDRNRLPGDFGSSKGKTSAAEALGFASYVGQPKGTTILFAADADFSQMDIDNYILPYFEEIKKALKGEYRIGAYGSGLLLKTLLDEDLIDIPWISMSRAFRGTKEFFYSEDWALRQVPPDIKFEDTGISYDRNVLKLSPQDIGVFQVGQSLTPVAAVNAFVGTVGPGKQPIGVQPAASAALFQAAATGSATSTPANAFVTTDTVNFRAAPDGAILRELTICDPVTVIGPADAGGWVPVQIDERRGHVFSKYLRPPLAPSIELLLRAVVDEWLRFQKGGGNERSDPYCGYVGEMWQSIGLDYDGRSLYSNGDEVPWSSAFISYVVRKAGPKYQAFKFSDAHSVFSHDAIQARIIGRNDRPFWGYRRTEAKPELGDIIHRNRSGSNFSFDYAENHSRFKSHSDVVVEVTSHVVRVIGGNVGDTVSMKEVVSGDNLQEYVLDPQGYIADGQKVIALLKNRSSGLA